MDCYWIGVAIGLLFVIVEDPGTMLRTCELQIKRFPSLCLLCFQKKSNLFNERKSTQDKKKLPIPSSWIPIKLWFQSETTQSILFIIRPAHLSKILKTSSKLPQKLLFCKPKRNIFIITAIQKPVQYLK